MSSTIHTITNGIPRDIVDAWETTQDERDALSYVDWEACERGEDSFSGFRYRGELYDLGEFEYAADKFEGAWDAWQTESYFSAVAIRYVEDFERVIVARLHW